MLTRQELEQAIKALPLGERETLLSTIEQSISEASALHRWIPACAGMTASRCVTLHVVGKRLAGVCVRHPLLAVGSADASFLSNLTAVCRRHLDQPSAVRRRTDGTRGDGSPARLGRAA